MKIDSKKIDDYGVVSKEIAKEISGSGGGQPFFATAGGSNSGGIKNALSRAKEIIEN